MVGELALWVKDLAEIYNIDLKEIRLMLIEALPKILSIIDDSLISKAVKYLKNKLSVEILTDSPITKVNKDSFVINNKETIKSHTLIWTGGVQANNCLIEFDL
jgi:NADH dehydrogenase